MPDLIITNGDSAAELLAAAGKTGTILPWRDILHEGPIVGGPLETFAAKRLPYLARRFRIPAFEIESSFAERSKLMRAHRDFSRVELWFEHDLYDQLQIIQILSFFAAAERDDGLILVQADDFLGAQHPETVLKFGRQARSLTAEDVRLGAAAWVDFIAPTPEAIADRSTKTSARLTYLAPALRRFLEELPAPGTGLGRTEAAILSGIAAGTTSPRKLFHDTFQQEEAAFMGDASFFHLIDDLAACHVPLVAGLAPPGAPDDEGERIDNGELELTMAGEDVIAGEADHVALSGLDRWWGGTRLHGKAVWRYDRNARTLIAP